VAERLQRSKVGPPIRALVSHARTPLWKRSGSPDPAPPHLKQRVIIEYVRRFRPDTFVETGTYRGDTLAKIAPLVRRAISIELDPVLAELAVRRFQSRPSTEIITGDSAVVLPDLVASLTEPALFWLDGHFSGGATAESADIPIMVEVDTVLSSNVDHVVLIDDVRLFDGTHGYPTIPELSALVSQRRPLWTLEVQSDIARVHAPSRP
jgi:hypothetical protein